MVHFHEQEELSCVEHKSLTLWLFKEKLHRVQEKNEKNCQKAVCYWKSLY